MIFEPFLAWRIIRAISPNLVFLLVFQMKEVHAHSETDEKTKKYTMWKESR